MKNTFPGIVAVVLAISACTPSPLPKGDQMAEECLKTKSYIINTTESNVAVETFIRSHPESVEEFNGFQIKPTADRECELSGQPLTSVVYISKNVEPLLGFNQSSHTYFVFFNKTRSEILDTIEVICPFGDDTKSAEIIMAEGNQALVDCSSFSSGGAMSGMSFSNTEFHIVDFAKNSEKLVWRNAVANMDGERTVSSSIDKTDGIPESFRAEILKRNKGGSL